MEKCRLGSGRADEKSAWLNCPVYKISSCLEAIYTVELVQNNGILHPGDRFSFAGFDWVCLDPSSSMGDGVLAIMASLYEDDEGRTRFHFDDNNNGDWRTSSLRAKLRSELLPVLGEENLIPKDMDLVADNGDDSFGYAVGELISILSADECRQYRKIIPGYSEYIWTCTPWRIDDAGYANGVRLCHTGYGGALDYHNAHNSLGVAPLVIFKSSIFQSHPLGRDDNMPEEQSASDEDLKTFLFG